MILFAGLAWAQPLVVVLREDEIAFSGATPRVKVTDGAGASATVDMYDDASAPDVTAGDRVWTGSTRSLGTGPYTLHITDGGDHKRWDGTWPGTPGETIVLSFACAPDAKITELASGTLEHGTVPEAKGADPAQATQAASTEAAPDGGNAEAAAPGGAASATAPEPDPEVRRIELPRLLPDWVIDPSATFGSGGRLVAWALVVAATAWVLAGARRLSPHAVGAVAGRRRNLGRAGLVDVHGDWRDDVRDLAGPFRVVVVGASRVPPVPDGTVFTLGPGRVPVQDVLALVERLDAAGPPLVLLVVDAVEDAAGRAGARALRSLARAVPRDIRIQAYPAARA